MGTSNTFEPAQTERKLEDFIRETADELRAGGSLVGAVAVSGAPGGDLDAECAQAGLDGVAEQLQFGGL